MTPRFLINDGENSGVESDHVKQQLIQSLKAEGKLGNSDWDKQHADYEKNVFSITQDSDVKQILIESVHENANCILIPGCGSIVDLQLELLKKREKIQKLVCTDLSEQAIKVAIEKLGSDHRVEFSAQDTTNLPFENGTFDHVIVVNSILSASDLKNRKMVSECTRVLKKGGRLVGLFPTIIAAFEISHLNSNLSDWNLNNSNQDFHVDFATNSFFETKQNMRQIFYSPLRLRRILNEAGLTLSSMSIKFFDGDHFIGKGGINEYYGLPVGDRDIVVYELLVIALKN